MRNIVFVLVTLLVVLFVGAGAVYLGRDHVGAALVREVAARSILRDTIAGLPDGLHVAFCGTGSPFPSPSRSGPCTAIIAGKRLIVVDVGRGAADVLIRMGLQPARLDAVLLTHFHSDHIDGLGQLAEHHWLAGGARSPLKAYGTDGVDRVANGFNEAYAMNRTYRIAHEGELAADTGFGLSAQRFAFGEGQDRRVVLEGQGLAVTAFLVNHRTVPHAVGYRFDYRGRSVVVSGDTAKSTTLVEVAAGADVLVHEAMSPRVVAILAETARASGRNAPARLFGGVTDFHTRPAEAADEATRARVRVLALTHFIPPVPMNTLLEDLFLEDAREHFQGPMVLAEDGDLISLPSGSDAWSQMNLLN